MQFSNNKTKRTRKRAEESVTAPLEAPGTQPEESAPPRPKRTAKKATESGPAITNHRKATKKADAPFQTAPAVEPIPARESATTDSFITSRSIEPAVVSNAVGHNTVNHEDIANLAYSYWERRGYRGGSPVEDWLRAERELRFS